MYLHVFKDRQDMMQFKTHYYYKNQKHMTSILPRFWNLLKIIQSLHLNTAGKSESNVKAPKTMTFII